MLVGCIPTLLAYSTLFRSLLEGGVLPSNLDKEQILRHYPEKNYCENCRNKADFQVVVGDIN